MQLYRDLKHAPDVEVAEIRLRAVQLYRDLKQLGPNQWQTWGLRAVQFFYRDIKPQTGPPLRSQCLRAVQFYGDLKHNPTPVVVDISLRAVKFYRDLKPQGLLTMPRRMFESCAVL